MSPLALNRTLCIIPARAGSRRIPGKNMKPFFGKPIIHYDKYSASAAAYEVLAVEVMKRLGL